MSNNMIISALIGLVGACNNNPKTKNTDRIIVKALAFSDVGLRQEARIAEEVIAEIHAEKNLISPGCATCQMPCGNTSDYDMERIYNADNEVRRVKLQILSELRETAVNICQSDALLAEDEIKLFYKALSFISYDLKQEVLLALLDEVQKLNKKTGEK